uniref:Uncharacterized protein n=1 Tax=Tanacetum cinerariifolium TaxID=118510 RepID=A0A6L2NEH5_TANCI|nr:hypothetical protein [Tanacetum cinerariifolium]
MLYANALIVTGFKVTRPPDMAYPPVGYDVSNLLPRQQKFIQKFYQLSDDNEEIEANEDDDLDDIVEIFKIQGNLSDFDTPLCKAFNEFNYLLKIDTDLFTFDMQGIKTYEEYWLNNNMTGDFEEPWSDNEGPYANAKTEKAYDPYLDINRIFGRNYGANNAGNTQGNKKEHHDPSIYDVRIFKMIKYSFDADEEYIAIKEHEHLDHSITNIDACQAYRELFRIMDEG